MLTWKSFLFFLLSLAVLASAVEIGLDDEEEQQAAEQTVVEQVVEQFRSQLEGVLNNETTNLSLNETADIGEEQEQDEEEGEERSMGFLAFRKDILREHTQYRSRHGVGPLIENGQLNQAAQKWASHLARTHKLAASQPNQRLFKGRSTGENVMRASAHQCCTIKAWYQQRRHYDYNRPHYSPSTASFTQLVWRSSRYVGIGIASTADNRHTYVVARYYPTGNVVHQFRENVPRPVVV